MRTSALVTLSSHSRACVCVQTVRVCFPWASIGQSEAAYVHRRRLGTGHAAGSLTAAVMRAIAASVKTDSPRSGL